MGSRWNGWSTSLQHSTKDVPTQTNAGHACGSRRRRPAPDESDGGGRASCTPPQSCAKLHRCLPGRRCPVRLAMSHRPASVAIIALVNTEDNLARARYTGAARGLVTGVELQSRRET